MMSDSKRDVLCLGLMVSDIFISPVEPEVFNVDSWQVDEPVFQMGGDALNQAIILHRLGLDVALAGCVGQDVFGDNLLCQLRNIGIDTGLVERTADASTATSFVLRRHSGERHFLSARGAADVFHFKNFDALTGFKMLSIGSLWGQKTMDTQGSVPLLKEAKAKGLVTAADMTFDCNGVGIPSLLRLLPYIDYLFPSLEEGRSLTGEQKPEAIVRSLLKHGVRNVILKLGDKGCYYLCGEQSGYSPAVPTKVIDTTGAGDNFTAAFLAGLARGFSPGDCARLGSFAGAWCVENVGATSAVYTFQSLEESLDQELY